MIQCSHELRKNIYIYRKHEFCLSLIILISFSLCAYLHLPVCFEHLGWLSQTSSSARNCIYSI